MSETKGSDPKEPIRAAAEVLQRDLAQLDMARLTIDMSRRPARPFMELLVLRFEGIKIRMDGNKNHKRPHVHVDYGKEWHTASYAIDSGERLAGTLDPYYDKKVREFVMSTTNELLILWHKIDNGQNTGDILCELRSSLD